MFGVSDRVSEIIGMIVSDCVHLDTNDPVLFVARELQMCMLNNIKSVEKFWHRNEWIGIYMFFGLVSEVRMSTQYTSCHCCHFREKCLNVVHTVDMKVAMGSLEDIQSSFPVELREDHIAHVIICYVGGPHFLIPYVDVEEDTVTLTLTDHRSSETRKLTSAICMDFLSDNQYEMYCVCDRVTPAVYLVTPLEVLRYVNTSGVTVRVLT